MLRTLGLRVRHGLRGLCVGCEFVIERILVTIRQGPLHGADACSLAGRLHSPYHMRRFDNSRPYTVRTVQILLQTTIPTADNDWSIARFSRLTELLRTHRDNDERVTFNVVARDRDPV